MSLFFGSRQKTKPQFSSLQVQSSSNNTPLPLVWGQTRVAPNLIWYGDFKATKQKPQGGKGGGGKGGTQYKYSASVQMALQQGVCGGVVKVWRDNDKNATLSSLGLTFSNGSDPQSPWSYLTAKHPEAALSYPGTAWVAAANYDLGTSASLPQHSFETKGLRWQTAEGGGGIVDADPALCVLDLLTLPTGGADFPSALIDMDSLLSGPDAPTTGDSAFQTYCQAMGFGLSPALTTQEQCMDVLDRWTKICNSSVIWNGAILKFVPFAQETITDHGVTYIPPNTVTTPIYTLTDADYVGDPENASDPVIVTRRNPTDQKNRLQMEILNRAKEYNAVPVEWVDQALVDQFGSRQDAVFNAHEVCDMAMATAMVQLMGQRNAYRGGNTYKFTVGPAFSLVEPMDVLTLVDPQLGVIDVQVDRIEEDDQNNFAMEASQVLLGATDSNGFGPPDQTPTGNDTGVSAGVVNTPIFIEPSSLLSQAEGPQVWAAVSGADTDHWGGAFVWISLDGTTFAEIGEITQPARMGKTTTSLASFVGTNPDTANTVGVDLSMSAGTLISVASGDAAAYATLCYLGGELLSYQDAVLTTTSHYILGTALYRALYGTTSPLHATNADFARLDDAIFKYTLPSQYIGKTLYFKFQSYNIFHSAVQDLATCTVYTYTPSGTGYGSGPGGVPTTPSTPSVSASTGFNLVTWTLNPTQDNIQNYSVYRAPGLGASFGSASLIGTTTGNTYTDSTAAASTAYTYFIKANNQIGASTNSAGGSITSSPPSTAGVLRFYGNLDGQPTASQVLFDVEMEGDESFLAAFSGSLGSCAVAPTGSVVLNIQKNGVTVGSMNIAAGATTATFTLASPLTFSSGDRFRMLAPSSVDATLSGIRYTFVGRRS